MTAVASILAVDWEFELRGYLTVLIGVVVLIGSIYLVLATNLGARLGFLVALAGLTGWMLLMGIAWMIYGIGLQGPLPSWEAVPGRTVLQNTTALVQAGVLEGQPDVPAGAVASDVASATAEVFDDEGWDQLDTSSQAAGQATASAGEFLEEAGAFEPGQFQVTRVFDTGGERYPKIGNFDFFAVRHAPHYVVVEVAPIEQTRDESGRAAPASQIDESRQRQYVYMIRDLGARRQPAFVLTLGSSIIFVTLCWLMHQRDARVRANLSQPAQVPVPTAGS
jgi:hypothetical protein